MKTAHLLIQQSRAFFENLAGCKDGMGNARREPQSGGGTSGKWQGLEQEGEAVASRAELRPATVNFMNFRRTGLLQTRTGKFQQV
jgi:hypothetical protein